MSALVYKTDLDAGYVSERECEYPVRICLGGDLFDAGQRFTPDAAEKFAREILSVAAAARADARADAERKSKEAAIRAEIEARLAADAQTAQKEVV
jgi:hypothetical protein